MCHQPKIGAWTVPAGLPPPLPLLPALLRFQDLALEPTPRWACLDFWFLVQIRPEESITINYKFRTASFRWESLAGSSPTHPCATRGAACKCKSVNLRQNGTEWLNPPKVYCKCGRQKLYSIQYNIDDIHGIWRVKMSSKLAACSHKP